jgi:heat-inducible transcriptional repressor
MGCGCVSPAEQMMATDLPTLSDRTRRILATLVREHIETGEPVASQALARRGGFGLSSATIRNVLVQLEELGYLRQPHTSAGRVPTDMGYRSYVDQLLLRPRVSRSAALAEALVLEQIASLPDADAETLLSTIPHMLAQASHAVAFALMPESVTAAFQHIEFVPLGGGRILVIVVARGSQVTHKVVDLEAEVSASELDQAAGYLNTEFSGLPLADVRKAILERLSHERVLYDRIMARALRLARASFDSVVTSRPLFVEGTSSLVDEVSEPYSGITLSALATLVRMIEEKHRLVHLLTEYIDGPGLTVVIGSEHPDPTLRQFSLVASTYSDGDVTGTVGLIGPLRMQYSRAIPMVDHVAGTVSRLLSHGVRPPHPADS